MYHKLNYYLKPKKIQLLIKFDRWRKIAKIKKLSIKARPRLEWIIFYYTIAKGNTNKVCRHFGISRSLFYFWLNRFNELNLSTLEDKSSAPKRTRSWNPDPAVLSRMIKLRKKHPYYSKIKLSKLYENMFDVYISSWQFQRVIKEFNIYPVKKKRIYSRNGAKKQRISLKLRQSASNLFSIDTKILWLFGVRYYIICAVEHNTKLAYARAYTTHSSKTATDFLQRLEYLIKGKPSVILTDNGSEFAGSFTKVCKEQNITRYYSKPRTPKDNPEIERFIQTLVYEYLNDGNFSTDIKRLNKNITDFLITYNCIRPHQSLNYLTPIQCIQNILKKQKLSKRCPSRTLH